MAYACTERCAGDEWWGGQSWLANQPSLPFVFIVGCGHSGTLVLLRLLAEHPQIHATAKESGLFYQPSDSLIAHVRRE